MAGNNLPPLHYEARVAVLEDGARRAERAERDLWEKLGQHREDVADDLKELRTLFDQNMKASAEIITAAREVVKRVDDVVRRQDNFELAANSYRETSLQRADDNAKAIDTRLRVIEQAHRDSNVRNRMLIAAWSAVASVISALVVAAYHKLFP